jgi:hypothetical protein
MMRWGLRIFWMCRVSKMFLHVFTLFPAQQQASQPCFDTDITSSSYRPPCRRQAAGQPVGDVGKVTHGSCAGPSQGRLQNLTGFWNEYNVLFFAALGCLFLHVYMWSNDPCIPKVDTKYSGSKKPGQRVEAILDDRRLRTLCCASGTNFVQPGRGPHCPKRQSLPVETSQPERKMFWKGGSEGCTPVLPQRTSAGILEQPTSSTRVKRFSFSGIIGIFLDSFAIEWVTLPC